MQTPVLTLTADDSTLRDEALTLIGLFAERGGTLDGSHVAFGDTRYAETAASVLVEWAERVGFVPSRISYHLCAHQQGETATIPCTLEPTYWEKVF